MKIIDDPKYLSEEHDPTSLPCWVETCAFGAVHISVMCELFAKHKTLTEAQGELERMWLAGEGPFAHDTFVGPYKWQRLRGEAPFSSTEPVMQCCLTVRG